MPNETMLARDRDQADEPVREPLPEVNREDAGAPLPADTMDRARRGETIVVPDFPNHTINPT